MARKKVTTEPPPRTPPPPAFTPFHLAKLVKVAPSGPGWIHEIKFDGYRLQIRVEGGQAQCFSRSGVDWTDRFPVLRTIAAELPDCLLDGEVCAMDERGYSDFVTLHEAMMRRQAPDDAVFWVFDILHLQGLGDLRGEPLEVRKQALRAMLDRSEEAVRRFIRWVEPFADANGQNVFRAACELGFEGIVSKRLDAPYVSGPTSTWRKTKCPNWQARLRPGFAWRPTK
jgi:bifunctional non-homologous end joining protein LigD